MAPQTPRQMQEDYKAALDARDLDAARREGELLAERDESFIHMGERLAREIGGNFRIQEIELTFLPWGNETHVLIEVDSRFGGDFYRSLAMGPDFASRNWADELRRQLPL